MAADASVIDLNDDDQVTLWARKLAVTREQLSEAVQSVGSRAADVELHLKGTRATTNAEQAGRGASISAPRT